MYEHISLVFVFSIHQLSSFPFIKRVSSYVFLVKCTSLAWINPISFIIRGVSIGRLTLGMDKYGRWNGRFLVWNGIEDIRYGTEWSLILNAA